MKENRDRYTGQVYAAAPQAAPPPLVTTPFIIQDQGIKNYQLLFYSLPPSLPLFRQL